MSSYHSSASMRDVLKASRRSRTKTSISQRTTSRRSVRIARKCSSSRPSDSTYECSIRRTTIRSFVICAAKFLAHFRSRRRTTGKCMRFKAKCSAIFAKSGNRCKPTFGWAVFCHTWFYFSQDKAQGIVEEAYDSDAYLWTANVHHLRSHITESKRLEGTFENAFARFQNTVEVRALWPGLSR